MTIGNTMSGARSGQGRKIAMEEQDISFVLARHDSHITSLDNRMTGVENKLDGVASVIHKIDNKITAQAAQPQFNIDRVVSLVKDISIMIGMAVAAIIWVTAGQFSGQTARQDENNKQVSHRLSTIESQTAQIAAQVQEKLGWMPSTSDVRGEKR